MITPNSSSTHTSKRRNNSQNQPNIKKSDQNDCLRRKQKHHEHTDIIAQSSTITTEKTTNLLIRWEEKQDKPVSIQTEYAVLPLLMKYGKKEHGMFKYQNKFRLYKLKKACYEKKIRLDQALSLRRHHIVNCNPPNYILSKLGLGSYEDIKKSSFLFEEALIRYLRAKDVSFIDEETQKKNFNKQCKEAQTKSHYLAMPPTPDCLLSETIEIVKKRKNNLSYHDRSKYNSFEVNWIDAKMFYGASTIELGSHGAVGGLLATAKKYVAAHGQGAFVFFNGYGEELEQKLYEEGVLVLDAGPLDLRSVFDHQKTWCANGNGDILP
jgi:hypothetical protein